MSALPDEARAGELPVREKAVLRDAGSVKVYVTKSRAVPVKLGSGAMIKRRAEALQKARALEDKSATGKKAKKKSVRSASARIKTK